MSIQPLTMQQVFDTAVQTMRARDYKPAFDPDADACTYRSKVGPCAIGASIPDELYDPLLENTAAHDIVTGRPESLVEFDNDPDTEVTPLLKVKLAGLKELFSECDTGFLNALQGAHDDARYERGADRREAFEARVRGLATRHGLTYTPPSNT